MAIVIGLDEAGYGPVLGPLVVAATAFEIPDDLPPDADLWLRLAAAVSRRPSRATPGLIQIADSKLVHQGDAAFRRLERNVLATCPLALPGAFPAFTRWLDIPDEYLAAGEPWHAAHFADLPLEADAQVVGQLREQFAATRATAGLSAPAVWVNLAQPWRFNQLVAATDNKATVLWSMNMELLAKALARWPHAEIQLTMDKQGGRAYYADLLREQWLFCRVETLIESPRESRYRIALDGRTIHLAIREKAETASLVVALASMYAKYVREVFMAQFNRWWTARAAELPATANVAPTAGYYTDYQRWAAEMAPLVATLNLPPAQYIRSR